jgi:hypothetical protein
VNEWGNAYYGPSDAEVHAYQFNLWVLSDSTLPYAGDLTSPAAVIEVLRLRSIASKGLTVWGSTLNMCR